MENGIGSALDLLACTAWRISSALRQTRYSVVSVKPNGYMLRVRASSLRARRRKADPSQLPRRTMCHTCSRANPWIGIGYHLPCRTQPKPLAFAGAPVEGGKFRPTAGHRMGALPVHPLVGS